MCWIPEETSRGLTFAWPRDISKLEPRQREQDKCSEKNWDIQTAFVQKIFPPKKIKTSPEESFHFQT